MNDNININIDFSGLWEVAIFITLIFVLLKCGGLIGWTLLWVLSPLIIVGGIELIVVLVVIVSVIIAHYRADRS